MKSYPDAASMVMDISPWPSGKGFQGAQEWWAHVSAKEERKRIDQMLAVALLDEGVRHRLIEDRDESLLVAFGLSDFTRQWLREVKVASLPDLAQAIVDTFKRA